MASLRVHMVTAVPVYVLNLKWFMDWFIPGFTFRCVQLAFGQWNPVSNKTVLDLFVLSALWIIMKILNHSIHISFWTKRQTMYFGDRIFAFCCGFVTVNLSHNADDHSFMFPGKYDLIVYSVSFIEL